MSFGGQDTITDHLGPLSAEAFGPGPTGAAGTSYKVVDVLLIVAGAIAIIAGLMGMGGWLGYVFGFILITAGFGSAW